MIANEIIARQLNGRLAAHAEYLAGLKKLENEYIVLKGLADAEAAEILKLQEKLAQLGGAPQSAAAPPMHLLQAAVAYGLQPRPVGGFQGVPGIPPLPPDPTIVEENGRRYRYGPSGELVEIFPEGAARQGPVHNRQDPWGTPAQTTDQMGAPTGDFMPRGKEQPPVLPPITQDMRYVDPDTKQVVEGL